jgi:hypothetical protein
MKRLHFTMDDVFLKLFFRAIAATTPLCSQAARHLYDAATARHCGKWGGGGRQSRIEKNEEE